MFVSEIIILQPTVTILLLNPSFFSIKCNHSVFPLPSHGRIRGDTINSLVRNGELVVRRLLFLEFSRPLVGINIWEGVLRSLSYLKETKISKIEKYDFHLNSLKVKRRVYWHRVGHKGRETTPGERIYVRKGLIGASPYSLPHLESVFCSSQST